MNQFEFAGLYCARPQNVAWFLGAGASRTAGLPTATDIIWDLKRRYYCQQENQEISRQDIQNEAVRQRIQGFMESRGFPPLWANGEYEALHSGVPHWMRTSHVGLSDERWTLRCGVGAHWLRAKTVHAYRTTALASPSRSEEL